MTVAQVQGVQVIHWNIRQSLVDVPLLRKVRTGQRVNNFGDLLGPLLVDRLAPQGALGGGRLLAVGSILHLAKTGDVVWGSGINAKVSQQPPSSLDVRAVRGPITKKRLALAGVEVPEVYGDPGVLTARLLSHLIEPDAPKRQVVVVPNLHDFAALSIQARELGLTVVNPQSPLSEILTVLQAASWVVGSSLHGLICAESLGVPATWIKAGTEPDDKYQDYYEGTGRVARAPASSLQAALDSGPGRVPNLDPVAASLMQSFPADLWTERQ